MPTDEQWKAIFPDWDPEKARAEIEWEEHPTGHAGTETDEAADWLKGAGQFPHRSRNAYDLRAELGDLGITPEEFRASVVYERWVGRMPWLAEVGKDG
jgi:hypothetical protein